MIKRTQKKAVKEKLNLFPAVCLIGPRQIGKTTLAWEIAKERPSLYLDLENPQDLVKLEDPVDYLESHSDKLIILDEIQNKPDLFKVLRGIIDKRRRSNRRYGQFLILGSASIELLRQSSETLAGRIAYIEMHPITVAESSSTNIDPNTLWIRGGFPDSLLSQSDTDSLEWRYAFIKTYLERDIPLLGPRIPAETLRRLWTMLAHLQGTTLNTAQLAKNLGVSGQTAGRYIDLFVDLFLVRRLTPWHDNVGKRLIRSPKIYLRDSGILHALLNIHDMEGLLSHPVVGFSWEGFIIDNLLSSLPSVANTYFYRTCNGAEIDLLIDNYNGRRIAIEIKRSSTPTIERGFHEACKDLNPTHRYVVYPGKEKFSLKNETYAIPLQDLIIELHT